MSAVKQLGGNKRYVLALLMLVLAGVLAAWLPFASTSATTSADPVAGKQAGPQANMPNGAASSGGGTAGDARVSEATDQLSRPVVGHSLKNDVSPPLRDIKPAPAQPSQEAPENRQLPVAHKDGHVADPVVQNWFGSLNMPTPIVNIDGINSATSLCGCYPPDTQGDVGPNHYIQWTNTAFQIFNKSGNPLLSAPVAGNTLWSGFGGV